MAKGGGSLIRKANDKPDISEEQYVARLMANNYEIGEFLIIDTKNGDKHVGFFGGVHAQPFLQCILASTSRFFNKNTKRPCLDHLHIIDIDTIENVKASPAKRDSDNSF